MSIIRPHTDRSTVAGSSAHDLAGVIRAPEWMVDALCAQIDPEMFFPEKGGSTRKAKAVCQRCPVAAECLDYSLENRDRYGIWGGLSERERRRILGLPEDDDHDWQESG